jgi:hypothetical protein
MKTTTTTLALASLVTLIATPAIAGGSSIPFLPEIDQDLSGNPIAPHCQDGWIYSTKYDGICIPLNGQEPTLPNDNSQPKPTTSNSNSSSSATASSSATIKQTINLDSFRVTPVASAHNTLTLTAGTNFDEAAIQANYTYQFGRPKANKVLAELEFLQACAFAAEFELDANSQFAKCPKAKTQILHVPALPPVSAIDYEAKNRDLQQRLDAMNARLKQLVATPVIVPAKN